MNVRRQDNIPDPALLGRVKRGSVDGMLMTVQRKWASHVVRMDEKRKPPGFCYCQLVKRQINQGLVYCVTPHQHVG